MELSHLIVFAPLAALVLFPLGREYADFRRTWGLGRLPALATTLLIVPALGLGIGVALPLTVVPALQWTATVLVTFLGYSLTARIVLGAVAPGAVARQR